MNKKITAYLFIILLSLSLIPIISPSAQATTSTLLFERQTSTGSSDYVWGTEWDGQSFTIGGTGENANFTIKNVTLRLIYDRKCDI